MDNSKIKRICNIIIHTMIICLTVWYLWTMRMERQEFLESTLQTLEESRNHIAFQFETIELMLDVIGIQEEAIDELRSDVDDLSYKLDGYQSKLIESEAELERVAQENTELKKSIADLHARNAQRISANGASITDNDKILLAQLVYSEARGESQKGQQAVVDVVLNRLADSRFPDTVRGVIMQANQFDEAHILHTYPATDAILNVVSTALNSVDVTNGALFFFNPTVAGCSWQWSRTLTAQIGPHRFSR